MTKQVNFNITYSEDCESPISTILCGVALAAVAKSCVRSMAELLERQEPEDGCFYGISECQNGMILKNCSFGLANCCRDVGPFVTFGHNAVEGTEKAEVLLTEVGSKARLSKAQ